MEKKNEALPYIKKAMELASGNESVKALAQLIENK